MPARAAQNDRESSPAGGGAARTRRWIAAAAFPVGLWFLATFFYFGDTGRWNDDWFCTLRDPASGAIDSLVLWGRFHFWRPLYRVTAPTLLTLGWEHLWLVHLVGALVHGGVAWLVWRFLRGLGLARQPAAIGALVFLVYPVHYEAILWPTAMPTALATGLMLGLFLLTLRWARGGAGWWVAPVCALGTFAAAALNEQPAGAALALPLIYFYACPADEPVRRGLARAMIPSAAAWAAGLVYIALHLRFANPTPSAGNGSFVPLDDAARHLGVLAMNIGDHLSLNRFGRGAFVFGAQATGPWLLGVWGIALAAAGWAWARHHRDAGPCRLHSPGPAAPWAVLALGGAIFVFQWAAVAPMYYWVNSRLFYAPMVGVAVLLGAGADGLARMVERRSAAAGTVRLATGLFFVPALMLSAVVMVGIQAAYRERAAADLAEARALREAIPDPAPGSVFVPVSIEGTTIRTGSVRFDLSFRGAFMSWWSSNPFVRFAYGRRDLEAEKCEWMVPGVRGVDESGLLLADGRGVPIERAIPFEIDADGNLQVVTAVRVTGRGGPPRVIEVPQTAAAAEDGRIPGRIIESPGAR